MGAEGGNFNNLATEMHVHDTKAATDDAGIAEGASDLVGRGIGGDIEILGFEPQQQVAHAATHDIGFETGIDETIENLEAAGTDGLPGYAMLAAVIDARNQVLVR